MEDNAHQPGELSSRLRVENTHMKARYKLSDMLRVQKIDRMISSLKLWIENGAPHKGELEEDSYQILRQYFIQKRGRLCLNRDEIIACKRIDEVKVVDKNIAIVLPQLYPTELLFRSHYQIGNQGIDKFHQGILKRCEWPGMKKACEKWVTPCLSCQQVKNPRKLKFSLQSIESSEFKYLPQLMMAYKSTQYSTTGISPHMMLTGHEKASPQTFFYPECEGKRASPQLYVRDVNRRQPELNDRAL